MQPTRLILCAAAIAAVALISVPEADAGWRWRRARATKSTQSSTYQKWRQARRPSTGSIRNWSGVSRAEYNYWQRRDAWYDHAYNGWRPADFR